MSTNTDSHAYSDLANCDTNNATRIGWDDCNPNEEWPCDYYLTNKRAYFQHLDRHNSGYQNGPDWQNKSYNTYKLNRNLIQCMGDRVRLGQWQTKRAIQLFDGLQRSNMGLPSEVVALSTCAYVIHRFDDRRECHPQTKPENRDHFFGKCRKDYDIAHKRFESVYGKVSHRIRNGELDTQSHDSYEVDANAEQNWRTVNDEGDGWP